MAQSTLLRLLSLVAYYWFACLNYFLYLGLSLHSGEFFRRDTEHDKNQYAIGMTDMMP